MEKVDEKERFERDRAFYRLAWNDGYDEGYDDGEFARPSKIKDVELKDDGFPSVLDQGWFVGYKVGYEEGVYERCREADAKEEVETDA